jgi:ankyrin repeat protein
MYCFPTFPTFQMCISYTTSMQIRQREYLWKTLCPSRWNLPRRPRVPWHRLYLTKIRQEEETARKQSDDVLLKAAPIIFKADKLLQIQKLIRAAKKKFDFNFDYTSGVVCERNSLLNLAVINRRHKIAKWLIEDCGAAIETVDRGNFSPLLNAAYNGDRSMVRYLLIRGANRKLIGKYHSSKGICAADFQGHNAEGWARERGHTAVADLIRLGL